MSMPDESSAKTAIHSTTGDTGLILNEVATILQEFYDGTLDTMVIERLVVGVFFVGVKLTNGCGGVAYTPPEVVKNAGRRILRENTPLICGRHVSKVISGEIPGPFAGLIRLATLNALSVPFLEGNRYCLNVGNDVSDIPSLFHRRRTCMVGAIIPLLKRMKEMEPAEVIIIDQKKETQAEAEAGYGEFVPPEHTALALARCETAIFTGATIANGTICQLIDLVPENAAIAVVGPTAGFVPEPLFQRRVALIGTVTVADSDRTLDILAEGGGAYRLFDGCVQKVNLLNVPRLQLLGLDSALKE